MPWTGVLRPIWEASTGWIATARNGLNARHLAREPQRQPHLLGRFLTRIDVTSLASSHTPKLTWLQHPVQAFMAGWKSSAL